jgi:exonuclease III
MNVEFVSVVSGATWTLTNIYAPCTTQEKLVFLNWFQNVDMLDDVDWLVLGDFNLIRRQGDRSKAEGNVNKMLAFNAAISNLRLEELKLSGNRYTWSNMQDNILLERLDWFFASFTWMTNYPESLVRTLSQDTSDHVPCLVTVLTCIPKAKVFRFENCWMNHEDFMQIMQHGWTVPVAHSNKAKKLMTKFKNLRRVLTF